MLNRKYIYKKGFYWKRENKNAIWLDRNEFRNRMCLALETNRLEKQKNNNIQLLHKEVEKQFQK